MSNLTTPGADAATSISTWQKRMDEYEHRYGKSLGRPAIMYANEEIADLRAALAAGAPAEPTASELRAEFASLQFNAQRLRNVVKLLGMESEVPESDAGLDGARGAVLGRIADKLRTPAATGAGSQVETLRRFRDLPLGTRFKYQDAENTREYVVIDCAGTGLVAHACSPTESKVLQGIYSAEDSEAACDALVVRVMMPECVNTNLKA